MMAVDWRHYAGRCVDRFITPLTPVSKRLPLQYHKHTLLGYEPEISRLRQYAPSGGIAVDAGANIGLWTYAMASAGIFDAVLAFEPNGDLTGDLVSAQLPSVRVIHKALSNTRGVRHLHIPRRDGVVLLGWASLEDDVALDLENCQDIQVETARLDDEVTAPVRFLKVDVEGHELHVLDGARRTVNVSRPVCLIECRERTLGDVRRWFRERDVGYREIDTQARFGFSLSAGHVLFSSDNR
jgi:FkbM family methyltransferase